MNARSKGAPKTSTLSTGKVCRYRFFILYFSLFKNEAGKGTVDPENLLDLWTRGD